MEHVKAEEVVSPRARWKLIAVLRDEGASDAAYAVGEWDGVPSIGMRWNGDDKSPIGSPQSRGLATWTIVEERLHLPILQTLSEDKQVLAAALLGVNEPPMVELSVAHHPSGRYTLTRRVSGQRMPEDVLVGRLDKAEFYREVYQQIRTYLKRGSNVVLGRLPD